MRSEFTMKDMAECERPYEKCLSEGAAVLSDAALLAVMGDCAENISGASGAYRDQRIELSVG